MNKTVAGFMLGIILVTTILPGLVSHAYKLLSATDSSALSKTNNADNDAARLFEGYPKNAAFDNCVNFHLNSEWHLKKKHLLYSTWFLEGRPNVVMMSMVDVSGKATSSRDVYNWARQNYGTSRLNEAQLEKLKKTLLDLPESIIHPPIKHLLIFSFDMKGKWITRTYDTSKLPKSILQIYRITGAPLEKHAKD